MLGCKNNITVKNIHAPGNNKDRTNADYYNSILRIWLLKDERELQIWVDEGKEFQSAIVRGE